MTTLHYLIFINAPKEKVWDTMLKDETYREWTKPFCEGSYYRGDWSEGSKIIFLGPDPKTLIGPITPEDLRREIKEELGRNVIRATLMDVFAHTGKRILPNCTNRTPGLGICYLTKLDSDEIHPTEQEDVHWACAEELRLLQSLMTPWCQYFLRDLLA